jgi:hypothetical protein
MAVARVVVTLGHATRASANLKVRQPLARAVVVVAPQQQAGLLRMRDLVADELNVKAVELASNEADLVTYRLLPNNKLLGPKYGPLLPHIRAALAEAEPQAAVDTLRAGQALRLTAGSAPVELAQEEVLINPQPRPGFAVAAEGGVVVALDTRLTPELRAEGLAREVVRRIQDLRKSAGFDIADRIITYYTCSPGLADAVTGYSSYIKAETLSVDLRSGGAPSGAEAATASDRFDGETLTLALVKAASASEAAAPVPEPVYTGTDGVEPAAGAGGTSDLDAEAAAQLRAAGSAENSLAAQPGLPARRARPGKKAARKAAPKKAAAKKTGAMKAAPTKPTTKKVAAKRTGARKTVTKKASVKKSAAKKTVARKTGLKTTPAKRTGSSKTAKKR